MPRVDFYILPENSHRERFVCSLAGKAVKNGHRVYIHVPDTPVAEELDGLLWTYNDISFVPHALTRDKPSPDCPVIIGPEEIKPGDFDVIINLSDSIPAEADQYMRIVEIVSGSDNMKSMARSRYRDYRSRNYELHNHTIDRV